MINILGHANGFQMDETDSSDGGMTLTAGEPMKEKREFNLVVDEGLCRSCWRAWWRLHWLDMLIINNLLGWVGCLRLNVGREAVEENGSDEAVKKKEICDTFFHTHHKSKASRATLANASPKIWRWGGGGGGESGGERCFVALPLCFSIFSIKLHMDTRRSEDISLKKKHRY